MKYLELENIIKSAEKSKICIFCTALFGSTWGYDLLKAAGAKIDFYCDNYKAPGTEIRDGVKIAPLDTLYSLKDNVYVFIAASPAVQNAIKSQLSENGIIHTFGMDDIYLQEFIEELVDINDPKLSQKYHCIVDDKEFLCRRFKYYIGYWPDLDHPKTFNEKLQWLKMHNRKPQYAQMVDKHSAKQYITDKIGKEYIIPTIGVYENFDAIDFDKLPQQFVLKCTHDSGSTIICKDKNNIDLREARNILETGLKHHQFWLSREWVYKNVKPQIIAEKYMEDNCDGELRDYKFFCFHGTAKILLIAQKRMDSNSETTTDFFNDKLEHINVQSGHANASVPPHMPQNYTKMKEIAEILSADIPHLRVDFYEVNGKIYIGEMTFFHQGGLCPLEPFSVDQEWGSWINLEQ